MSLRTKKYMSNVADLKFYSYLKKQYYDSFSTCNISSDIKISDKYNVTYLLDYETERILLAYFIYTDDESVLLCFTRNFDKDTKKKFKKDLIIDFCTKIRRQILIGKRKHMDPICDEDEYKNIFQEDDNDFIDEDVESSDKSEDEFMYKKSLSRDTVLQLPEGFWDVLWLEREPKKKEIHDLADDLISYSQIAHTNPVGRKPRSRDVRSTAVSALDGYVNFYVKKLDMTEEMTDKIFDRINRLSDELNDFDEDGNRIDYFSE